MVLSRRLVASDIGAFFFAVAFAESFVVIGNFGMTSVMARRVAASPADASVHFGRLLGFRIVSAPVYLIVIMSAALLFTKARLAIILAAAVMALLEDLYFSFGTLWLGLRKAMYNVTLGVTAHTLYVFVFLAGMWAAPSLEMLIGVTMFRSIFLISAGLWIVQSRLFPLRTQLDWSVVRAGLPFVVIAGLHVFRDQIGTLMLGALSSYESVAHYNLAWRLVASALFFPTAICAVFVPLLSAHGLTADNRRLTARAGIVIGVTGCAGGLIAWFFAVPLAAVFYGPLAPTVAPLIQSLAILFPIGFLALFLSLVLQALYQESHVLRTLLLVTLANLAANWILVPRFGARGAVHAQILATFLQLVILGWRLRTLHAEDHRVAVPEYTVFADGSP